MLAIGIHGFLLATDYRPFYGSLLRPKQGNPQRAALFLPVAHLAFTIGTVWAYLRLPRSESWLADGLRYGVFIWLVAQVPHYLIWFAEQPWPGTLVVKQLALELASMLILGMLLAAMLKPDAGMSIRQSPTETSEPRLTS